MPWCDYITGLKAETSVLLASMYAVVPGYCLFVRTFFCRTIFKNNRFPSNTKIVGYARSALTIDNLKEKCKPFLKVRGY